MPELTDLVSKFVEQLSAAIESDVLSRVRSNVESVLGGNGRGRPAATTPLLSGRKRRKGPIQLCPVPGCTNRAAPVFGMVCSDHKNVSKAKIRKYREARKAGQDGGKSVRATKAAPARRNLRKGKRRSSAPVRGRGLAKQQGASRTKPAAAPTDTTAAAT